MIAIGLSLMWAAIQATLLALVAMLVSARPWRIGGAFAPLCALLIITFVTVTNFVPKPQWWPRLDYGPQSPQTLTHTASSQASPDRNEPTNAFQTAYDSNSTDSPVFNQPPQVAPSFSRMALSFLDELRAAPEQPESKWSQSAIPLLALLVFTAGLSIGLIRLFLGLAGTRELRKRSQLVTSSEVDAQLRSLQQELGCNQPIEVRQSSTLSTAATMGIRSSLILLPAHWQTWSPAELRAVLAHELAHIQHRDFLAQLASQLGIVLHFYNPIIHWLAQRLKLEQELAADAVAASLSGGQREYLRVLARLALDHENNLVGWPARAFLPTRETFLRRLDMLRASKSRGHTVLGRLCALAVIGMVAFWLVAIRPTADQTIAQEPKPKPKDVALKLAVQPDFDLRYIDQDAGIVVGIQPRALLETTLGKQLYQPLVKELLRPMSGQLEIGLEATDVEQLVVAFYPDGKKVTAFAKLSKSWDSDNQELNAKSIMIGQQKALELSDAGIPEILWQPDPTTLVFNSRPSIERFAAGKLSKHEFESTDIWSKVKGQQAFLLINRSALRDLIPSDQAASKNEPLTQLAKSFLSNTELLSASLNIDSHLKLALLTSCQDEPSAKNTLEVQNAIKVLAKAMLAPTMRALESQPQTNPGGEPPANTVQASTVVNQFEKLCTRLLDSSESKAEGKLVSFAMSVPLNDETLSPLLGLANTTARASARSQSTTNMKQLALGMHNFHGAYGSFPAAAAKRNNEAETERKYPYSWRVAILPYIERQDLYDRYNFDEPWDSPSNSKLLKEMPSPYRHPDAPAGSTNTSYVVLVGEQTMFPPGKAVALKDITDGSSNTIMLVEAKTEIPWTKPEDLTVDPSKPLPPLGGYSSNGYNVSTGDGRVSFFAKSIDAKLLWKLITARGGEQIP